MQKTSNKTISLTYSRITSHTTCPMKEHFQYCVNGVGIKPTAPYIPFIEGEFGHYILKHYYTSGQMLRKNLIKRIDKLKEELGEIDPVTDDALNVKLSAMLGACLGYKVKYRYDKDRYENLLVEEPFELDLGGGVKLEGVIDWTVKDKETGRTVLFDHKFVSSVSANKYAQLPLDLQGLIYCYGFKALKGKFPDMRGWNFILKSQLRRKGKIEKGNLETLDAYEARVCEQYQNEPERMFFRPPPVKVDDTVLKNLEDQLNITISNMIDSADNSVKEMRFSSCLGNYGSVCSFIQACTAKLQDMGMGGTHRNVWELIR